MHDDTLCFRRPLHSRVPKKMYNPDSRAFRQLLGQIMPVVRFHFRKELELVVVAGWPFQETRSEAVRSILLVLTIRRRLLLAIKWGLV